jgi:hypothetical protein
VRHSTSRCARKGPCYWLGSTASKVFLPIFLSDTEIEVIKVHRERTGLQVTLCAQPSGAKIGRIQTGLDNFAIRAVFFIGRLVRRQNELMILTRRADANSA